MFQSMRKKSRERVRIMKKKQLAWLLTFAIAFTSVDTSAIFGEAENEILEDIIEEAILEEADSEEADLGETMMSISTEDNAAILVNEETDDIILEEASEEEVEVQEYEENYDDETDENIEDAETEDEQWTDRDAQSDGVCGENASWTYDEKSKILTVNGTGEIWDQFTLFNPQYTGSTGSGDQSPIFVTYLWVDWIENQQIKSANIENGITRIGEGAFYWCVSLESVSLPQSLDSIGIAAFYYCPMLENIDLPSSITEIGGHAFDGCERLSSIKLPDNLTRIGEYAFQRCKSLTSIDIPASVTKIDKGAFANCANLSTVTFHSMTAPTLGEGVFDGVSDEINIIIPEGATGYDKGVWKNLDHLCGEDLTWEVDGSGTLTIRGTGEMFDYEAGSYAPWTRDGNYEISKVFIEPGVTSVGKGAFRGSSTRNTLTSVTIPDGVTRIGDKAFYDDAQLTEIELPESVTEIGGETFSGCRSLAKVEIPESVTKIGDGAFEKCHSLTSVTIPDSVTRIGDRAFYYDTQLTEIELPETIIEIGNKGFAECESLTKIDIPESVTMIGDSAFEKCYGLSEIELPNGLNSIGEKTFYQCNIRNIVIPANVKSIGSKAFAEIWGKTIRFTGDAPTFAEDAFEDTSFSAYYPSGNATWTDSVKQNYGGTITWIEDNTPVATGACGDNLTWELDVNGTLTISGTGEMDNWFSHYETPWRGYVEDIKCVIIQDGVTSIGKSAFNWCENLVTISIPDSVTSIGMDAFEACLSLTEVSIPEGVTEIQQATFNDCSALTSVTLPSTLTSIKGSAFADCEKLKNLALPENIMAIEYDAFWRCTSLTELTLSEKVSNLGVEAFEGCTGLKKVTILSKDISIGTHAFGSCTNLTAVYFKGNAPEFPEEDQKTGTYANAAFEGDTLTAYFPAGNATWTESVRQNYGGTVTWVPEMGEVGLDSLTYKFSNSTTGFGYSAGYFIPLKNYQRMFGVNTLSDTLYLKDKKKGWGGNCYGMSSTSGIFNGTDNSLWPYSFQVNAGRVYDLGTSDKSSGLGITVRDFIECMQISQDGSASANLRNENMNKLNELVNQVKLVKDTGKPVLLCIYGLADGSKSGHAVLGYDVEQVSQTTARLYVYDCNYPNTQRYLTLTGRDGNYTGWYYYLNNRYEWGSSAEWGSISYIPYSWYLDVWNTRGSSDDTVNLMILNSNDAEILDVEDNVIARVVDGSLVTDQSDIYQVLEMEGASDDVKIYLPSNRLYTIKNQDMDLSEFEVAMTNIDLGTYVTTDADTITLAVNDSARTNEVAIEAEIGQNYTIEMKSSADTDTYDTMTVQGICQNSNTPVEVSVQNSEAVMNVTEGVSLTVDGKVEYDTLTEKETEKPEESEKQEAHNHTWDQGKVTKQPTALAEGVKTYTCKTCGKTKTEQIKKLSATITLNTKSITLKTKQSTKVVTITGLASGDYVKKVTTNKKNVATGSFSGGKLTIKAGKKTGSATITITLASGKKAKVKVKVQKKKVTTKKITGVKKSLTLKAGKKAKLVPVLKPITSSDKITYQSTNTKVAKVDKKGNITALKKGKATIIVKSGSKSVKCKVTVK